MSALANQKVTSLAARTRRQLLLLGVVIFVGLVTLVTFFSFYQIEQATESYMRLEAAKLEQQLARDGHVLLANDHFSAYQQWDEIPPAIRQLFNQQQALPSVVLDAERTNEQGIREYVYLVYSNTLANTGDKGIYVVDVSDAQSVDVLIESIVEQTIVDASVITSGFIVLLFVIIAGMFRNALRPLNLLVDWSQELKEQHKQQPEQEVAVNFSIKELNDIAEHLLVSLKQVQDYNIRERQFLKHASHELRTPLAIIQASLDTLGVRTSSDNPSYPSLQRANRASNNMILLTEALLWLARQSNSPIPVVRLQPDKLLQELIDDLAYLLDGKAVEVKLESQQPEIVIEQELFRIVLTNLVRNAFQHSCDGEILIDVNDRRVLIVNPIEDDECEQFQSVQSFGLGLQLVERIAAKLNWDFDFAPEHDNVLVAIYWHS